MLTAEAQKGADDANKASMESFKAQIKPVHGILEEVLEEGTANADMNAMGNKFIPVLAPYVIGFALSIVVIIFYIPCVCFSYCPLLCKKRKNIELGHRKPILAGTLFVLTIIIFAFAVMGFSSGRVFTIGINKFTCAFGSLWDTTVYG